MLLALGWSEHLLAVEWQRIDLAAFRATPTTNETCVLVCEGKGPWRGLADDFEQAKGYVDKSIPRDDMQCYFGEEKFCY